VSERDIPSQPTPPRSIGDLASLEASLHQGSAAASQALAAWIGKPSVIEIDSLEQLALQDATGLLGKDDQPICFGSMAVEGVVSGELILAFDDPSGWALADLLLAQPPGTTTEWTEMAVSAALETTNILGCAYLNSLSQVFSPSGESSSLVPAPPRFSRDFAESLLQFALMGQAVAFDQVILARTRFTIDGVPVNWTFLFVPDAESTLGLPSRSPGEGES
jgi:chemotaxis protein CheC